MVSLKFHCLQEEEDYIEIKADSEDKNIWIFIEESSVGMSSSIILNRETAIKLSKELRKQIDLIR